VPEQTKLARFEQAVLPHMDAAYNLARWLTRRDQDAEDVVQEAYLRAFRFFDTFHGGDARTWLLTIIRNTCYTWLRQNRANDLVLSFDDELQGLEAEYDAFNPEVIFQHQVDRESLMRVIEELPVEFREVIVLREIEDLSYKDIARVAGIPIGTVMSRLARARARLQHRLSDLMHIDPKHALSDTMHDYPLDPHHPRINDPRNVRVGNGGRA